MDIKELKTRIVANSLKDSVLIFKYQDNKFLCYHYIDHICKNKNLEKIYINSLNDINNKDDLFESESKYLYILDVEKLTEDVDPELTNVIIVCKTLPDNLSVDYIDITKLVSWQIEDFVKMRLPGLDEKETKWLCEVSKYDIYRLDNECAKLEIFSAPKQKLLFKQINQDNGYVDLGENLITTNWVKQDNEDGIYYLYYISRDFIKKLNTDEWISYINNKKKIVYGNNKKNRAQKVLYR